MAEEAEYLTRLKDKLTQGILTRSPDSRLNGHPTKRLPNIGNVSIKGVEGESMIISLDMLGICSSSGSACTSGTLEASHVLLALGLPHELAHASLRLSLGRENTEEDVDTVINALPDIINRLRTISPM